MTEIKFRLTQSWEDLKEIKDSVKKTNALLVTLNNKYISLIERSNVLKTNLVLSSPLTIMQGYTASSNAFYRIWVNYQIEFFNIDSTLFSNMDSEIVVSLGNGFITGDSSSFRVPETLFTDSRFDRQRVINQSDSKIVVNDSLFILDLSVQTTDGPITVIHPGVQSDYFTFYPKTQSAIELPLFYSKLILKFNNQKDFY